MKQLINFSNAFAILRNRKQVFKPLWKVNDTGSPAHS